MRAVWLSCCCLCELEKVVGGAYDRPLALYFLDTTHQELPEPSCRLDLPEHRLDDLLPEAVSAAPAAPPELALHRLGQWAKGFTLGSDRVLRPSDGDVALDVALIEGRKVRLRAVAGI